MPTKALSNYLILAVLLLFAFAGQSLIKLGLRSVGSFNTRSIGNFYLACIQSPYIWAGLALVGVGFCIWIAFLSRVDLSQALPMLAVSYVGWLIIGRVFFHEAVGPSRIAGVVLICAGVFLVGRK